MRAVQPASPVTLTVSDGERYSARRLHAALCKALNRSPWLPSPPRAVWRVLARGADLLSGLPRGATWQRLKGEERVVASDLSLVPGYAPRETFESALITAPETTR